MKNDPVAGLFRCYDDDDEILGIGVSSTPWTSSFTLYPNTVRLKVTYMATKALALGELKRTLERLIVKKRYTGDPRVEAGWANSLDNDAEPKHMQRRFYLDRCDYFRRLEREKRTQRTVIDNITVDDRFYVFKPPLEIPGNVPVNARWDIIRNHIKVRGLEGVAV